jgi:multiple sugar transport system ATP-binding protein
MSRVSFQAATCIYPRATRPAVDALDLEIEDGEFLVLVGPSGCGKSTSLRMIAGLEDVTEGSVFIGDRDVTELPPKARDVAMVFQNYALYPHMTVAENMGFALRVNGMARAEIAQRVKEAAVVLDLEDLLARKPKQLSGGQRQRVAMGRAIVRQPQVFLMDEPLSNLDAKLRVSTRTQIAALQRRLGTTTVYVTHDQVEAMTMGDRVAVLHLGVLQQCATPAVLYDSPANVLVAGFIGSPAMNLLPGTVVGREVEVGPARLPLPAGITPPTSSVTVGVRPEALEAAGPDEGFPVVVEVTEELGSDAYVYASFEPTGKGEVMAAHDIVARVPSRRVPHKGETIRLRLVPGERMHLFDSRSGDRLD